MSTEDDEGEAGAGDFLALVDDFEAYVENATEAAVQAVEDPADVGKAEFYRDVGRSLAGATAGELRTLHERAPEGGPERLDRFTRMLGGDEAGGRARELAESRVEAQDGTLETIFEIVEVLKKVIQDLLDLVGELGWLDDIPVIGDLLDNADKVLEILDNLLEELARLFDRSLARRMHETHKRVLETRALRRESEQA